MTEKLTRREAAKRRTRARTLEAARLAFTSSNYHAVTMRDLIRSMGTSNSAVFAHFSGKAELFEAAMGFKPPLDGPVTRAAPMLLASLKACVDGLARNSQPWIDAQRAIELAETPLDGEAWARHLEAIRQAEPHSPAEQPAASAPSSDAAGDQ